MILLFEFLNFVLLVGLLVVWMFGTIVLEAEKQLEEWESYQEYKETLLATREGEVSMKEATTKETRMPMVEAQPSMMPASSSSCNRTPHSDLAIAKPKVPALSNPNKGAARGYDILLLAALF